MIPSTNENASPLAAGGSTYLNESLLKTLAADAAGIALRDYRAEQKRGRQDQGSGDAILGGLVESVRVRMGWTQEEMARRTGLHPTTIGKIESGQRGMSLATFCKLAQALHIAGDWKWTDDAIAYLASK